MSEIKRLLNSLLWEIYGRIPSNISKKHHKTQHMRMHPKLYELRLLQKLDVQTLNDVCEILNVEIRLVSKYLERVLISRDKNRTYQTILYGFLDVIVSSRLGESSREMRFNLSPSPGAAKGRSDYGRPVITDETNSSSDFNQWLHAMKMVARLPGGMPPEFRRKLWLALADKYLKAKNVDWEKEEVKCFSEQWREDDEELGIQIVKDLHRTGSSLCSGPAGTINQAKLKRILLGYARYNPEVGYCQGFNMLGALILQVMDKEEIESIKVMIYLVEGILPSGYFSGSLGGLQADMAVFRELMTSKLPRLAKHLQKLQGPVENAFEPPLTNVFTMQWFLTMFCTCLPMTCVLRVWDLVLIEGSDVLLRTALVLWSLLEERILNTRTADDFYCKMGSFSSELLNGHLIDSNGLVEKVVDLGPIPELQKLRDKHLYNISPFRDKSGLQLYYSDDEGEDSDDDSRMAVATAWGLRLSRRGSAGLSNKTDNKDRIALDISLLKKQYDRLRERQRQAHIILTSAVARQGSNANQSSIQMNQLLIGRNAIVTNNGRRLGPPQGAIPPARKPSLPTASSPKPAPTKSLKRGETLHWRDTDLSKRRRGSLKWKDIKSDSSQSGQDDRTPQLVESAPSSRSSSSEPKSHRASLKSRQRSDSSSYSEESDGNSSTSTSLCDEDDHEVADINGASLEGSPMKRPKSSKKHSGVPHKKCLEDVLNSNDDQRTVDNQIPFIQLTTMDSPVLNTNATDIDCLEYAKEDSETESNRLDYAGFLDEHSWPDINEDVSSATLEGESTIEGTTNDGDFLSLTNAITSTSLLSPIPDIPAYISSSSISPLCTPISAFDYANLVTSIDDPKKFDVNDEGVTNEYFERINIVERPTKLDLLYSLNEEDSIRNAYKSCQPSPEQEGHEHASLTDIPKSLPPSTEDLDRKMKVLLEYSNQSSLSFIAEAKHEISSGKFKEKAIEPKHLQSASVVSFNNACSGDKNSIAGKTLEHTYYAVPTVTNATTFLNTEIYTNVRKEHLVAKTLEPESTLQDTQAEVASNREETEEYFGDSLKEYALSATFAADKESQREDEFQKPYLVAEKGSVSCEGHAFENDVSQIPTTEDLETRFRVLELSFTDRKKPLNKTIKPYEEDKPPSHFCETSLDSKQGLQKMENSDSIQPCTPVVSSIKNTADFSSNETALALKPHLAVGKTLSDFVDLSPIFTDTEQKSSRVQYQDTETTSHKQISDDLEMKSVVLDQLHNLENQRYESENNYDQFAKSDIQTHTTISFPSNETAVKEHSNNYISSPIKELPNAPGPAKQCEQSSCDEEGLILATSESYQNNHCPTEKQIRDLKSNFLPVDNTQETSIAQTLSEVLVVSTNLVLNKEEDVLIATDQTNKAIVEKPFEPHSTYTLNTADESVDKKFEQNVDAEIAGVIREIDTTRELGGDLLRLSLQPKLAPSTSSIEKHKYELDEKKTYDDEPVDRRPTSDDDGELLEAPKRCITKQETSVESMLPSCKKTQMLYAEHLGSLEESDSKIKIGPKKTGIPSTEELETRFTALERQFSDKAIVVPKQTLKDCFETVTALVQDDMSPIKLRTNKSGINTTNSSISNVTTNKTIPSTLDLEHRFREFERKLSATSLIPLSESKAPQQEELSKCTIAKNPSILLPDNEDIPAIKPNELPSTISTNSDNHADITGKGPNFLRKRIPSTEDLESRFDALERQKALKSPTAAYSSLLSPSTPTMVCATNGMRSSVPSTQDLENRFQALEEKKLLKNSSKEKLLEHEGIVLLTKLSDDKVHDPAKNNSESKVLIEEELIQQPQQSQHSDSDNLEGYQSNAVSKENESVLFLETIKDQQQSTQVGNKFVPSTKDLESRFEALEKRKSFTGLSSNSKESTNETPQDLKKENEQGPRTIPSTEALESRFEALEQRKSVSDDFTRNANQSCPETLEDSGNNKKIDLKKIPSTKDLETRFDALEQRKSFTDDSYVPNTEDPNEPNDFGNKVENDSKKVPSTKDLENRFESLERKKSNNDIQCTPKKDKIGLETLKAEANGNKINIKKIPSTKDLETRFEALEQRKSISDDHFTNKKEEATFETSDDVIEEKKVSIKRIPSTKDLEIRFDALEHGKAISDNGVLNKDNESSSMAPKKSVTEKEDSNENLTFNKDSNTQAEVLEHGKLVSDYRFPEENHLSSEHPKDTNNAEQLNNKKSPSSENSEFTFKVQAKGTNDNSNIFTPEANKPSSKIPEETIFEKLDQEKTRKEVLSSYTSKTPTSEKEQKSQKLPSTQDLERRFEALDTAKSISDSNLVEKGIESMTRVHTNTGDIKVNNHKDVPSTKDLENRFQAFANQKQTEQRSKTKQEGKQGESDSISLETPSIIPSATDLETRFEALEKQKLALSANSRCKNVDTKNSSKDFDKSFSKNSPKEKIDSSNTLSQISKPDNVYDTKKNLMESETPPKSGCSYLMKISDTEKICENVNPTIDDLKNEAKWEVLCTPKIQVLSEKSQSQAHLGDSPQHKKRKDLYKLESQSDETLAATDQNSHGKTESRPTSCPEYANAFDSNIVTTDRVLKIIEENSKILHRILKKTLADSCDTDTNGQPRKPGLTDSLLALGSIFPQASESTSPSRIMSHSWVRPSINIRSDDNISDRLASIKSTIKSIDTLCEEKSFRKEKCQRYIDSLFARPTITAANPSIRIDDFEHNASPHDRLAKRDEFKKDCSPRRRRDEDREEYESRVRRNMMPNSLEASSDLSCSLANIEHVDSEVDMINQLKNTDAQMQRPLSPYYMSGYDLNKRSITPVVYIPTKLEIRHTTVTSTFYDRYLTEKQIERTSPRNKKSPSVSPTTMTKSYLDIAKCSPTDITDRSSKSAENSPSRKKITGNLSTNETVSSTINRRNLISTLEVAQQDLHIRSCDNILLQLRSTANHNKDIVPSIMMYSPLPAKIRKPTELGISLGLYKDYGSDESSKS